MQVKIGQVWRDKYSNCSFLVVYVGQDDIVCERGGEIQVYKKADDMLLFVRDAIPNQPQPSDLDIVQKALEQSRLYFVLDKQGVLYDQYVEIKNLESLLTWAKQTVGE